VVVAGLRFAVVAAVLVRLGRGTEQPDHDEHGEKLESDRQARQPAT
jgi:hypothetical protein